MAHFFLNQRVLTSRSLTSLSQDSSRRVFKACTAADGAGKFRERVSMVQGASRGIGLEFVKQLLEKNDNRHVIATCRNPDGAIRLHDLKEKFSERLSILQLDLIIESTIEEAARSIEERYGLLNLLINASGILSIPDVMQPERTLGKVEKSSLLLAYEVNAVGPMLVIKHMWPLLKAGGGSGTERDFAVVASLSARVGSIGDNHLGGWHSYRSSKAALNQLMKTVSLEFEKKKDPIICLQLHPGTVDTDLSRPFQRNVPKDKLFTREFSVKKLLSIIDNAKRHDNGKFFAWDGQEIPWLPGSCSETCPECLEQPWPRPSSSGRSPSCPASSWRPALNGEDPSSTPEMGSEPFRWRRARTQLPWR